MFSDARLVAAKDLRIELRSKVATNQVLPFAVVVLILFAFALNQDSAALGAVAPGLYWVSVLFSALLAVQRSFAIESSDAAGEGMRLSGLDPAGIFLGKAAAVAVQLAVLEVLLAAGMVVLYGARLQDVAMLAVSAAAATVGLAAAGVIYGALAAELSVRETLLPLLLLPVLAPVLMSAARSWQDAMSGRPGLGVPWAELLVGFAVVYVSLGVVVAGPVMEVT